MAKDLPDDELLINFENMLEMGIIKYDYKDLGDKGFTHEEEEDNEEDDFEEDKYGLKIRKVKKMSMSGKDQKLGEMRERLIKKFPEIFKGSLKESHMKMEPVKIQMEEDGKKYHKPATLLGKFQYSTNTKQKK